MAKLTISQDNSLDWLRELGQDVYLPMIEQLAPIVAESTVPESLPDKVRTKLIASAIENSEWSMSLTSNEKQGVVSISGPNFTMRRIIRVKRGVIVHSYFEVGQKLQNKGLAEIVLNTTAKVSDKLGINKVILDANLDVGGYAWLRKGFFPEDVEKLIDVASGKAQLLKKFEDAISNLSSREVREFVLTDAFREYRDLFLGSSWEGQIDLSDPISREAFIKNAYAAEKLIKSKALPKAMTYNEQIYDSLVRRQTYMLRYARNTTKESINILKATEKQIRLLVLGYADDYAGLQATSAEARALFKQMEQEILSARQEAWVQIQEQVPEEFAQFAALESAAMVRAIEAPFPIDLGLQTLSPKHLNAIVKSQPFEGRTLSEWLKRAEDVDVDRIVRNAKNGMIKGLTPTQVARSVMGSAELDYRDGQVRKVFNDLEATYLTVTNGIGNQIKQDIYAENADIIETEYYVATLDIRTTVECAGNDGKTFKRGEGPIPPLHFRCRSLRIPYINPEALRKRGFDATSNSEFLDKFAEENNLGRIASYDDLPRGYKAAYNKWARIETRNKVGQVPATQNFDQFLRNQSVAFQNEYLGIRKAEIFRQGNLTLDQFVTKEGYELTIPDLEKLANTG